VGLSCRSTAVGITCQPAGYTGELEHIRQLGLKGATVSIFPSGRDNLTPEDDTFWKAALDMKMCICVHQEFNRDDPRGGAVLRRPQQLDNRAGQLGEQAHLNYTPHGF